MLTSFELLIDRCVVIKRIFERNPHIVETASIPY